MTVAAIYTRVSVKDDTSNARQLEACEAFCKAKGWDVGPTFQERGITGTGKRDRSQWRKLTAAVEAKDAVIIVGRDTDHLRLSGASAGGLFDSDRFSHPLDCPRWAARPAQAWTEFLDRLPQTPLGGFLPATHGGTAALVAEALVRAREDVEPPPAELATVGCHPVSIRSCSTMLHAIGRSRNGRQLGTGIQSMAR